MLPGGEHFNRVMTECLTEKVAFERKHQRNKLAKQILGKRTFQTRATVSAKALGWVPV